MAISPIEDDGLWPSQPTPESELLEDILACDVRSRILDPSERVALSSPPLLHRGTEAMRVVQSLRGVLHIPEEGRNIGIVEIATPKGFGAALADMVPCPHDGNLPSLLGVAATDIPYYLFDDATDSNNPHDKIMAILNVDETGGVSLEAKNRPLQAITANGHSRELNHGLINPATWYLRPSTVMRAIQSIKPRKSPDWRNKQTVQNRRILPA